MKKKYNYLKLGMITITFISAALSLKAQNIWFNELHYDNNGGDVGEFVEVVLENPGSYTLSDFTITLYNGSIGQTYNSETLDNFAIGIISGNFTIYTWYPSSIQNGSPDGMVIDYQGSVISGQFLSYEGTFTATNGVANGMTSVDIGVSESGGTQVGESLQLSGNGTQYPDFIWEWPAAETPGQLNNNQSFSGHDPEPTNYPTDFVACATGLTMEITWTDAVGGQLPSAYLIKGSTSQNITPPVDGVPESDDFDFSDGDGAINVAYGEAIAYFYGLDSETEYFFEIYPYTNAGTNIDYKNDGTPPASNDTTDFAIETKDFESGDFGTWTTYSVASDKDWQIQDFGGALGTTYFAEINGYQENELSNDWLISPSINFNNYVDETMLFWTRWRYGNTADELTLKYSTDYTGGDPTQANWTDLSFTKPGSDQTWENSGFVDLSGIVSEDVTIAFQYLSSGSPRRWRVDQIEIAGVVAVPVINVTSPQTGDKWEIGSTQNITWNASNTQSLVRIELSTNASSGNPTWEELVDGIQASQGSWTWDIPGNQETSYDCRIRISDYSTRAVGESGIFWLIEPAVAPEIVITEIMYNPPESGTDSLEFIELYNNDDDTVNLDGYYFADGLTFEFGDIDMNPGDYFLLAKDSSAMRNTFNVSSYQWESGALSNTGELIQLVNEDGFFVDSVHYADASPWPTEPDGNGPSLTFCTPDLDNAIADNWTYSVEFAAINQNGDTIFATPGSGCLIAPVADFEADATAINVGDAVTFTDLSLNNPKEWSWSFDGGEPSSSNEQQPPMIYYNSEGEFNVTLVVSNDAGEDTENKEQYIKVGYKPDAGFIASDTAIDVGGYVDYTDLSENNPESWEWLLEGGIPDTSTEQNPLGVQYNTMGVYDVRLIATNMFGSDTMLMEDYIQVGPVSIDKNKTEKVSIYPNPTRGTLVIVANHKVYSEIVVYSAVGKMVYSSSIKNNIMTLHLDFLNEGLYFVKITGEGGLIKTNRLILEK